jgi:type I restriction enzyme S subunit
MGEWITESLDDCLEALIDYRGKSPERSESGIPVLSAKVVKTSGLLRPIEQKIAPGYYPTWMVRGFPCVGDVVMTTEAPLGEVIQLDEETAQYALGQRVVCMRGKANKVDNTFLRYLLSSPGQKDILERYATGTTVFGISQKALRSVPISHPDIKEQQRIGSLLRSLDDKIDLNRRMNEDLQHLARAFFADWFINFNPTRAKASGESAYLAPEVWPLFPDSLDESGLPEGWGPGTLTNVTDLNPESWSRSDYPETISYVDLANTKWGVIEITTTFNKADAPSRAQRILRPGDTVVGTVRPGNGSYAFISSEGLTASTGFAVLRPKKSIFREAIYLAATSQNNISHLAHMADGGAYPAVRPEVVQNTGFVDAPEAIFAAFSETVGPLMDRIEANKAENSTLAGTRDFLLPKLMSGEISVSATEKKVGELV